MKAAAGLVGDVGGTNARFALVDADGKLRYPKTYPSEAYASLNEIVEEYVTTTCGKFRPGRAAIAVAGPVVDGETQFTNLSWTVSRTDLVAAFEFEAVSLLNDFAAQALAAPVLEPDDLRRIGPQMRGAGDCPIAVLGPGTGFGVAALARSERGDEAPLATEAAHGGFAPFDELELELWRALREKYGRVSTERVLSGQGIHDLYVVLARLQQQPAVCEDEKAVHAAAVAGNPLAVAVLDRFCEILGGVAGDLALAYGARGGVYIGGGIAPRLLERLSAGGFRRRFEDKGRLSDYVAAIPTQVIVHPYAALVGAARELEQMESLRL